MSFWSRITADWRPSYEKATGTVKRIGFSSTANSATLAYFTLENDERIYCRVAAYRKDLSLTSKGDLVEFSYNAKTGLVESFHNLTLASELPAVNA